MMDYLVILGFWGIVLTPCLVAMSARLSKGADDAATDEETPPTGF